MNKEEEQKKFEEFADSLPYDHAIYYKDGFENEGKQWVYEELEDKFFEYMWSRIELVRKEERERIEKAINLSVERAYARGLGYHGQIDHLNNKNELKEDLNSQFLD